MPVEKYKHGLAIKGAIIMDMILEYDNRPNSQTTQQLGVNLNCLVLFVFLNIFICLNLDNIT